MTSAEAAASCQDVGLTLRTIADDAKGYGANIRNDRSSNQVAGYFGALFIIPLIGVQHNTEEKRQLDVLQTRWDRWIDVAKSKQCPFDRTLTFRGY